MSIDFGKIVTNALSALVATVFVSAAAIVWTAATTIDDKISSANRELDATQTVLSDEIADLQKLIDLLEDDHIRLNKALAEADATKNVIKYDENAPSLRMQFEKRPDKEQFRKKETARIKGQIDQRRLAPFGQSPPSK